MISENKSKIELLLKELEDFEERGCWQEYETHELVCDNIELLLKAVRREWFNEYMIDDNAQEALEDIEEHMKDIFDHAYKNGVTALSKWKFEKQCEVIKKALAKEGK